MEFIQSSWVFLVIKLNSLIIKKFKFEILIKKTRGSFCYSLLLFGLLLGLVKKS
jgi:hypothetical protein